MVGLRVWGKDHCVCVVVIDLRYIFDLLWNYSVPDKLMLAEQKQWFFQYQSVQMQVKAI